MGGIIREKDHQIESGNTTPLINDLEMQDVFKDEDEERGDGVMDLISGLVDLLLLKTKAVWDAWQDGIELIELWDEE